MASSSLGTIGANFVLVAFASSTVFADMAVLTVATMILSGLFRIGTDRMFIAEVNTISMQFGLDEGLRHGARLFATTGISAILGGILIGLGGLDFVLDRSVATPLTGFERLVLAAWLAADIVRLVAAEAQRAQHRFLSAAVSGYGARAPLFLVLLVGAHVLLGNLGRSQALVAAAGASVLVCIWSLTSISRTYSWWRVNPARGLHSILGSHMLMLVSGLTAMAIGNADVWIVGATVHHHETAQYALAVSVVGGLAVLSTAINGGLSPYIASAVASGNAEQVQDTTVRYVRFTSVLAVFGLCVIAILLGPVARRLGGPDYRGITTFVLILGLGQVISTMAGLSGYVLTAARHYRPVTIVTTAVASGALVGELIGGLAFGSVLIIAVTSSCATAALPIINNIASRRRLGIRTDCFAQRS